MPELRGRTATILRALLPGPYTLVVPNPARRYRWLAGARPDTIGVRVPELAGQAALDRRAGRRDRRDEREPRRAGPIRADSRTSRRRSARASRSRVDGGELPGIPSTVVDLTGAEPRVLREGAVPAAEARSRVRDAMTVSRKPE